jgi:hypothetical protein
MVFSLLFGCTENNLTEVSLDAIGVVQGDFDDLQAQLIRNEIGSIEFNGYIDQATWWVGDDRPTRDDPGRTVEELLTGSDAEAGVWEIEKYNAVFVNSGTRGLNAFRYNYTMEADDSLLLDPVAVPNVCDWVHAGGSLVVSDWAYDLVETCWPDEIDFFGEDAQVDAAQVGAAGDVLADVPDEKLREAIGGSVANITFNYSAFAVMQSVSSGVEVLLSGEVQYQPEGATLYEDLPDSPLAVRFEDGRGQVLFTSFHSIAQTPALADAVLFRGVDGLQPGAGKDSEEASGE